MPVWPKSLYTLEVNFLTAATEWKLRQKRGAAERQERTYASLVGPLAGASYWREAGVEPRMPYARFQAEVAPRSHEAIAPAIERMKRGESGVLWPGRCAFFARTPGTTDGNGKLLPVTGEMLAHFRRATMDSLLYYTVRVRHAGVFRGRHLDLGGSTELTPLSPAQPHEAYTGDLDAITAVNRPAWIERHLHEPGARVAQIADWDKRIEAIVERSAKRDISLLSGLPPWVLLLARALRKNSAAGKGRISNLQGLWPNFECFVHRGVPLAPFHDELRAALGPTVHFHEIYSATEGFIAAQDVEASAGLRLLADTGLFFEFLPVADYDETRLDQIGAKAVPLAGARTGVDYVLLVTTPAGLARHVTGDVVRLTSLAPPRLISVGRTQLQLGAFGERVTEKDLTEALLAVCQRHRWTIANFHVAPVRAASRTGQQRGHHEWWLELKPGADATPQGPKIAAELDVELQRLNGDYASRRKTGGIDAPVVRLVMPGVFEHWLRYRGKWGGNNRTPRCRSDRLFADELAQMTNFALD